MSPLRFILLIVLMALLVVACANEGNPADAVGDFLEALMAHDSARMSNAVCPEWEAQAALELDAFSGVSGSLEGVACEKVGDDNGDALIVCQGKMILDYNGELRDRDLASQTYRARRIDGEWKMCGYE